MVTIAPQKVKVEGDPAEIKEYAALCRKIHGETPQNKDTNMNMKTEKIKIEINGIIVNLWLDHIKIDEKREFSNLHMEIYQRTDTEIVTSLQLNSCGVPELKEFIKAFNTLILQIEKRNKQ